METSVEAIISKINRKYGDGTVVLGSEIRTDLAPRATSGSLAFDVALGGGWPTNRWNEIIGSESHGKTVLVLKTVAANQARDPEWTCVWIAAEDYDKEWASALGVDNSRVILVEENEMETAFQIVLDFAATKAVDCVVIDSLPMLEPNREREGVMDDFQPGLAAFVTGKFFRKARKATKRSLLVQERPVLGLVINQWREKIGVMHGDPRTTPGGKAKNFAFATRVEVRRDEWIKDGDNIVGQVMAVKTVKNKTYPSQKKAYIDFYFEPFGDYEPGDYDLGKDIALTALATNVVLRQGAWYKYGDQRWQGRESFFQTVAADEILRDKIQSEVLAAVTGGEVERPKRRLQRKR